MASGGTRGAEDADGISSMTDGGYVTASVSAGSAVSSAACTAADTPQDIGPPPLHARLRCQVMLRATVPPGRFGKKSRDGTVRNIS